MNNYIVKKGDSLNQIVVETKTPFDEIVKLNGLKSPWVLTVGQKLKLNSEKSSAE